MLKKLHKSVVEKKIGGICGGLGEFLDVDPTLVRLATVIAAIMTAIVPFIIVYIIAWFIIPEGSVQNDQVKDPPS
jgi:phage shock protein C